jgi:hypothetical protein
VGVGAIFILLVVIIVVAVLAAMFLGLTGKLRRDKMHPEGDRVEAPQDETGVREEPDTERRPTHVRVSGEQRTRFIPDH